MSHHQSYREESRRDWGKNSEKWLPTEEQLKFGAILRIADAVEKMAQRHTDLISERDSFERLYWNTKERERTLERRLAAAKCQITKLKKRLFKTQTQAFGGDPRDVAFRHGAEPAGGASSAEGATSTVVLEGTDGKDKE